MDSYIVRIYRRTNEPTELAGQVEKAGTEKKMNFLNSSELVKVLMNGCSIQSGEGSCTQLQSEIIQ